MRATAPLLGVLTLALALTLTLTLPACETKKTRIDRRKDAFEVVAGMVNGPIRDMQPFHRRIVPADSGGIQFLDEQLRACFEADPLVAKLEVLKMPLDEQGNKLSTADDIRASAESFRSGIRACKEMSRAKSETSETSAKTGRPEDAAPSEGGGLAPEAVSKCLLQCMRDWRSIVLSVDQVRQDADWLGVRVESLAPLVKNDLWK